MIPIQIEITAYCFESNTCTAKLQNGNNITLDPFVGCAIRLSDEDYEARKGADVIGKKYVLISYSVYPDYVAPHEDGMIKLD